MASSRKQDIYSNIWPFPVPLVINRKIYHLFPCKKLKNSLQKKLMVADRHKGRQLIFKNRYTVKIPQLHKKKPPQLQPNYIVRKCQFYNWTYWTSISQKSMPEFSVTLNYIPLWLGFVNLVLMMQYEYWYVVYIHVKK